MADALTVKCPICDAEPGVPCVKLLWPDVERDRPHSTRREKALKGLARHPRRAFAFRWPSGETRPLAHLTLEPEEIASRLPAQFAKGQDDLDAALWALLNLGGEHYLLIRHAHAPRPGTEVQIDSRANRQAALDRLLDALGQDPSVLDWYPPDLVADALKRGHAIKAWRVTSVIHNGAYSTWALDDLCYPDPPGHQRHGTFGNVACMVEALHDEGGQWVSPDWSDEKHGASLYAYAGWWDPPYKSENHPDFIPPHLRPPQ